MISYLDKIGLEYFWGKIKSKLSTKVDKVDGKGLSTNDYTTAEKNKLAGIAEGAEVNVLSDWNATSGDAVILNKPTIPTNYAGSPEAGGTAYKTASIPYTQVDSTSTAKAFTATVDGITELRDGVCCLLKNGRVTSASGFTLNVNNLGAKPCYTNLAAATRDTTIFNINYTMLFVYDSTRVDGGCWICFRGYYYDNNYLGYLIRTNYSTLTMSDRMYRYRLYFTSADRQSWVPSTTSTATNATSKRDVNQRPIDPFGPISCYGSTSNFAAGATGPETTGFQQYAFSLGYAFNTTGTALTLTLNKPVYVKCTPQTDGSAIIDADEPYTQNLPTSENGFIYIFLGIAYSATLVELRLEHPVYYYKNGAIRLWTNHAESISQADITNWNNKQDTLMSGTNIKTINNESLLGSGNLSTLVPIVNHGTSDTTYSLTPNVFHVWGQVVSLTLTLTAASDNTVVNEYMFIFESGSTPTVFSLTGSGLKWDSNIDTSTWTTEANTTYEFHIANNIVRVGGAV